MATEPLADFDEAMTALGLAGPGAEAWREGWDDSQATYPPGGPEFLREPFVREICGRLALAGDVREAVVGALPAYAESRALRHLAWHCHARLFRQPEPDEAALNAVQLPWPTRPEALPAWGEMFHAVVLLSGGPYMTAFHAQRGIGAEVTRATAADLELWMRHYRGRTGRWGLAEGNWLAGHFLGRLYALGRLQFRFETFAYGFRAYRRTEDGRIVLLAPGGRRFRPDGQFDGADGVFDAPGAWTSAFAEEGDIIRGNPVTPDGRALGEAVALPADRWRCVLAPGDPILGVHIPATGPMDCAACGESFRRAAEFFPRHFPRRAFHAFICTSWFLDNQLGRLLPPESNIRRFQEEVHLFPLPGASDGQTFERVWGVRRDDARGLKRDTALRRVLADHLAAGGRLRAGGCLLLPADIDWGRQVYRRRA